MTTDILEECYKNIINPDTTLIFGGATNDTLDNRYVAMEGLKETYHTSKNIPYFGKLPPDQEETMYRFLYTNCSIKDMVNMCTKHWGETVMFLIQHRVHFHTTYKGTDYICMCLYYEDITRNTFGMQKFHKLNGDKLLEFVKEHTRLATVRVLGGDKMYKGDSEPLMVHVDPAFIKYKNLVDK